jgi:CRISPR/Cas system CMR-associated protein Cmr3 (group 5 of RAMP superfamily)
VPAESGGQSGDLDLPLPSTLAGMVRTALLESRGAAIQDDEEVRKTLDVKVRGPWLVGDAQDPNVSSKTIWVPAPHDAWSERNHDWAASNQNPRVYRAGLSQHPFGEHCIGPNGHTDDLRALRTFTQRLHGNGQKADWPVGGSLRYWRLEQAIDWATCSEPPPLFEPFGGIQSEPRTHLSLDSQTLTAKEGMLFTSEGRRYRSDFAIGFSVQSSEIGEALLPGLPVRLGGKGRVATLGKVHPGSLAFPRKTYQERLDELKKKSTRVGLRLQLITPGCLDDGPDVAEHPSRPDASSITRAWLPAWAHPPAQPIPGAEKYGPFALHAVCMPARAITVSGWNVRKGAPKRVRRLIPAGTVYVFEPEATLADPYGLVDICELLWFCSLFAGTVGDKDNFLASPEHDGFGIVLPGFMPLDAKNEG